MKDSPHKHKFHMINTFGSLDSQYYKTLFKYANEVKRKTWKREEKENKESLPVNLMTV